MNIWRVTGIVLMAGIALFLVSLLLKFMLIVLATGLLVRVIGGQLVRHFSGSAGRVDWPGNRLISIDNPIYRSPMNRAGFDRTISIS